MNKVFLAIVSLLILCAVTNSFAQTQQGVVKTRGKMVNGTHVPGQGLPGAVVSVKGRGKVLVQNENGEFSFSTPDSKFKLDSVSKKGYVLVDFDCVGQELTQSANAVNLVMETPSQLLEDKLAAERKIRRSLYNQFMAKLDELDALKEQNKITVEEYHKLMQELNTQQEKNEKLISQMADKYSKLDYDQLDDFYREVSNHIINGELAKADSLLSTKGNLNADIAELKRLQSANAQEKEELARREENLKKSEGVEKFKLEDLAKRCYSKYEICKLKYEFDSAAYYLETRANLDTTNIQWTLDVGVYYFEHMADWQKGAMFVNRALCNALNRTEGDDPALAECYSYKAFLSLYNDDFSEAKEFIAKSLDMYIRLFGENHQKVAETYSNIGEINVELFDIPAALSCYFKSLDILLELYGENHKDVALLYSIIGEAYIAGGDLSKAQEYHNKALDVTKELVGGDNEHVAYIYSGLAGILCLQKKYSSALDYGKKALNIDLRMYGNSHPSVSNSYRNIAWIYQQRGDFSSALEYSNKAVDVYLRAGYDRVPMLASLYNDIGNTYCYIDDYGSAMDFYNKALAIDKEIWGDTSSNVAGDYRNIALGYRYMQDYPAAMKYNNMATYTYINVYGEHHPDVARCFDVSGLIYLDKKDYMKAIESFTNALNHYETIYDKSHPDLALSYSNIGFCYLHLNNYTQVIEYAKKAYEIYVANNEETSEEAGNACYDISWAYNRLKNYPLAYEYLLKALEIKKMHVGEKDESVQQLMAAIRKVGYRLATDGSDSDFANYMSDKINVVTLVKDDEPITYKGLKGELYLLEVEDWNFHKKEHIFDKIGKLDGKSKRALVMKNGKILELEVDADIEMWFTIKQIDKKEKDKDKIINLYKEWKQNTSHL